MAKKRTIWKTYYTGKENHQVLALNDSIYNRGPEYLSFLESLSFPVRIKYSVVPLKKEVESRSIGRLIADRKSEIRYSKGMGDAQKEKIRRQIADLERMSNRVGTVNSSLVDLKATYTIASPHPVKLAESSGTFKSAMRLIGFEMETIRYMSQGMISKSDSILDNLGAPYLIDTYSLGSILPLMFTPVPEKDGVLAGVDDLTEKPVIIDLFGRSSHNALIFGETGSGKSFFAKLFLMRHTVVRPEIAIHVVDPLDEYSCSMFERECTEVRIACAEDIENFTDGVGGVTIFKVPDLMDAGKEKVMESLLLQIYSRMTADPGNEKIVLVDEAHLLLSNAGSREIMSRLVRHSRHYSTSIVSVTQSMGDLSRGRVSSVIAENSSSVFIFRSRGASKQDLEKFGLENFGPANIEELMGGKNSAYSECELIQDGMMKKIRIICTELESKLISGT